MLQAAFYSAAVQRTAKEQKMPAHRTVLESENSSKADNARKNTAFPPVCKKCAEPQKKENPTRNLTILRGILVRSRELESLAL